MQIVIDIPEDVYVARKHGDISPWITGTILDAIEQGTPLSNNSTNGEVIKAMFNVKEVDMSNTYGVHFPEEEDYSHYFFKDWWNAPYQKGGNVE